MYVISGKQLSSSEYSQIPISNKIITAYWKIIITAYYGKLQYVMRSSKEVPFTYSIAQQKLF